MAAVVAFVPLCHLMLRAEAETPLHLLSGTLGDRHILVDQFGYRPQDAKVAVIRTPVAGYDAADIFSPGEHYVVRNLDSGQVVFTGSPTIWEQGRVETSSGDKGWWFDFSALKTPGHYEIMDLDRNAHSAPFAIAPDVYRKVLREAMRTYFYQRSGFAKREPYAQACWVDDPAYLGAHQDVAARDVTDPDNAQKAKDLRGGWFDAGDTNKYLTFAATPVHQLLAAFEDTPGPFTDDFGIPESGNGIPDVLDELRWELDWFARMQGPNGGVLLKVGALQYRAPEKPSQDSSARFYVPECSSSTIAAAAVFAHAALVFKQQRGLESYGAMLGKRAVQAWDRFDSLPDLDTQCDSGVVKAGNADKTGEEQRGTAAQAAIYLYGLTHDARYRRYVEDHYRAMQPYRDFGWGRYQQDQGRALLWFTRLAGVSTRVRNAISADFRREMNAASGVFGWRSDDDLYRAFMHDAQYHWGSLQPRANYGNVNLDAAHFTDKAADANVLPEAKASMRQRALETLHYFHGVNPFGMVFLSNMQGAGANRSVQRLFHAWYQSNYPTNSCGAAPGYVTGGANAQAAANGVPSFASPPVEQPMQKAYRDSNDPRLAAWTFNEPGIYYQSAYIKLLSEFVQ